MDQNARAIKRNFCISKECYSAVKGVIDSTGLYNGTAEFVRASLRSYILDVIKFLNGEFVKLQEKNYTEEEREAMMYSAMRKHGKNEIGIYQTKYEGDGFYQVQVRLSEPFMSRITEMSNYLFDGKDQDVFSDFARAAVTHYIDELSSLAD